MIKERASNHPSEVNMWTIWEASFQISKHLEGDASTKQILFFLKQYGLSNSDQDNLLILGCGTGREGIVAAEETEACIQLLDPNGALLGKALHRVEKHGLAHRISILRGTAEELPLQNESVNAIIAQQVFSQASSHREAFVQSNRVLERGGILAVNEMLFNLKRMPRFLQEQLPESIFIRSAHQYSESYIEDLLEETGFHIINTDIHPLNIFNQLNGYVAADGAIAHLKAFYNGFTHQETREAMFNIEMVKQIVEFMPMFMQTGIFYAAKK